MIETWKYNNFDISRRYIKDIFFDQILSFNLSFSIVWKLIKDSIKYVLNDY